MLTSIAFDEDSGDDKEEDCAQRTSQSDQYDEANRQMTTFSTVSRL